jgi:RimJ/RimL family protein N-acetyltransferase
MSGTNTNYIIKLEKIVTTDYDSLYEITSNPEVTQYIGDSKPWSPEKTKQFIKYCIEDDKKPDKARDWFTYKITYNGQLAGIIEFKATKFFFHVLSAKDKSQYKNDVILTIYINPKFQGKGIARAGINLLKDEIRKKKPRAKRLLSMVRVSNGPMRIVMDKLGFVKLHNFKIKNEMFILYSIDLQNK